MDAGRGAWLALWVAGPAGVKLAEGVATGVAVAWRVIESADGAAARRPAVRVIAGSARGRRLAAVPGVTTRPITDRAKEALFSILAGEVPGASVLDLFAGTGSVGIEALSRGASSCVFVEQSPAAVRTIQANLRHTGLEAGARVVRADVFAYLARPAASGFDLVYVAPPQYHGWWHRTLSLLDAEPRWLAPDGLVTVQIHPREQEPLTLAHLALVDERNYGGVRLLFFQAGGAGEAG